MTRRLMMMLAATAVLVGCGTPTPTEVAQRPGVPLVPLTHDGTPRSGLGKFAPYYNADNHTWDEFMAWHYDFTVSGSGPLMEAMNPAHKWLTYESITDSYTWEDPNYEAYFAARGVTDYEDFYLHFADSTVLHIQGVDVEIPAGERAYIYYSNGTRRAHNFASPTVRTAYAEWILDYVAGQGAHGVMADNCSGALSNTGSVVLGGTIAECGYTYGSSAFGTWAWEGRQDFMQEVTALLEANGLIFAPNVTTYYGPQYMDGKCATILLSEYQGNPIRDWWPGAIQQWDRLQWCIGQGMAVAQSANPQVSAGGGTIDAEQMRYGCMAQALFYNVPGWTYSHIQDGTGPGANVTDWDVRIQCPVEPMATAALGQPTGPPVVAGTLPDGGTLAYRPYEGGRVYLRQRNSWSGNVADVYDMPNPYPTNPPCPDCGYTTGDWLPVSGYVQQSPATIPLYNGDGAVLLERYVPPPPQRPPKPCRGCPPPLDDGGP